MKIEDHWEDVQVYYVTFEVGIQQKKRCISKSLVFSTEYTEADILEVIKKKFNSVIEIVTLDLLCEDALELRQKHQNIPIERT